MSRFLSCVRACSILALCVGISVGCGKKDAVPDTVPVSGKVTVDGQPVTSGQVSFMPFDKEQVVGGMSAGTIDSTGGYVVYTGGKSGVSPGRYKVTVTPSMMPTGDNKMPSMPFDPKFSDAAKTPLIVNVAPNADPETYHLKLTKGK